jgi:membrane-bound inhibitor of C-type lysozyme
MIREKNSSRLTLAALCGAVLFLPLAAAAKGAGDKGDLGQIQPDRLEFPRGVKEQARKGSLRGSATREYVFSAAEGQSLSVKLDSKNRFLVFSVLDLDSMAPVNAAPRPDQVAAWEGRAPKTGDFLIRVYLVPAGAQRNLAANYTLKVGVAGGALAQASNATGVDEPRTFTYRCDDNSEVLVKFLQTDPPKAQLNRQGREWNLPLAPSGSGSRYSDGHTTFWIKGSEAMFELDGNKLNCKTGK